MHAGVRVFSHCRIGAHYNHASKRGQRKQTVRWTRAMQRIDDDYWDVFGQGALDRVLDVYFEHAV